MSEDKLSEEGLREEIKNLLSWGHAHDYDDIIREARADAWDEGYRDGHNDGLSDGHPLGNDREPEENPYRKADHDA